MGILSLEKMMSDMKTDPCGWGHMGMDRENKELWFFWKYLNQRAVSASSRTGQIQVNTFFCLRFLRLFILALHNQYILLLSEKKNKGKHRMLLSILKFKIPYVLGSTSSDLQDRGIPLPQACKEVRRHGFPTPLLPSSPNYCPRHKTRLVGFNEGFGRQQGRR